MRVEANCSYKAHIPQMLTVPGKLILDDHTIIFKAYGKDHTPFDLQFDTDKVFRYKQSKGLLGGKLFIYYNDHEWYKFRHFSKEDLKAINAVLKIN